MREIKVVVRELVAAYEQYLDQLEAQGSMYTYSEQERVMALRAELERDHGLMFDLYMLTP